MEVVEQDGLGKLESQEAAIDAFQSQVRTVLQGYLVRPGRPTRENLLNLLAIDDKLRVRRQPLAEALRRVQGTLSKIEQSKLILYGKLDDLADGGDCWVVESTGDDGDSICGYLDQSTGKLLFVWIIPEG